MNNWKNSIKNELGITLIVLLITIIVLLILAGVSIKLALNNDSLIISSTDKYREAQFEEKIKIAAMDALAKNNGKPSLVKLMEELQEDDTDTYLVSTSSNKVARIAEGSIDISRITDNTKSIYISDINKQFEYRVTNKFNIKNTNNLKMVALNYDANGGTDNIQGITIENGEEAIISELALTRDNYTFAGWTLDREGTGKKYLPGEKIKIEESSTLYAQWTVDNCVVRFDVNGGTALTESSWTVAKGTGYGTKGNFPTATPPTGKILIGWYTQATGGERITKNTTANADTTVYAHYATKVEDFNYNGTDGSNGSEQRYLTENANITYKIECWGAAGGKSLYQGVAYDTISAYGGYTCGKINIKEATPLYIYVGGKGINSEYRKDAAGGYNGGGLGTKDYGDDEGSGGGGGATDIRLANGNWDSFDSLKSRIMVAAGAGGDCYYKPNTSYIGWTGGAAGGLEGYAYRTSNTPGKQNTGYQFGVGQNGSGTGNTTSNGDVGVPGAGGGWYGGTTNSSGNCINGRYDFNGTGGSSFIAGHSGCNAINTETSTSTNIVHTNDSKVVYNNKEYVFTDTLMIDGEGYVWTTSKGSTTAMPNPSGGNFGTNKGNNTHGHARITIDTVDINN